MFVKGDQSAAMQAFMGGKIKVEGDMTKLMAMQSGGAGGADRPRSRRSCERSPQTTDCLSADDGAHRRRLGRLDIVPVDLSKMTEVDRCRVDPPPGQIGAVATHRLLPVVATNLFVRDRTGGRPVSVVASQWR